MKHTFLVIMVAAVLCAFLGCSADSKKKSGYSSSVDEVLDKGASYALGMNVGSNLKSDRLYPDLQEFAQGIRDIVNDAETRYTMDEAYNVFNEAFTALRERREEKSKQAEQTFLEENGQKPGITVTESGLQYEVITEGEGPKPLASDTVRVHYKGTLLDGTVFDSSYEREEPIEFPLGGVIPGWTEGLQLMSVGSNYRLFIPSELGYGSQGARSIPPYSTLIFEVELLDIIQQE